MRSAIKPKAMEWTPPHSKPIRPIGSHVDVRHRSGDHAGDDPAGHGSCDHPGVAMPECVSFSRRTEELAINGGAEGVQSGRGRNPTPSTWVPGTAQDARRHGERHVCIGIPHGARHLSTNQATHPPPVRQFGRPAACAGLQDPPGPLTAVAARGWRPYGGINPSLGCKFAVQATVRTGKSLTVGFRPLPDWTPGNTRRTTVHARNASEQPRPPPARKNRSIRVGGHRGRTVRARGTVYCHKVAVARRQRKIVAT